MQYFNESTKFAEKKTEHAVMLIYEISILTTNFVENVNFLSLISVSYHVYSLSFFTTSISLRLLHYISVSLSLSFSFN